MGVLTFTDPDLGTVRWIVRGDGTTAGPYVRDRAGAWVLVPESDLDARKWTFDWIPNDDPVAQAPAFGV